MSTGLADIRSAFLDFFGEREHEVVASSPQCHLMIRRFCSPMRAWCRSGVFYRSKTSPLCARHLVAKMRACRWQA